MDIFMLWKNPSNPRTSDSEASMITTGPPGSTKLKWSFIAVGGLTILLRWRTQVFLFESFTYYIFFISSLCLNDGHLWTRWRHLSVIYVFNLYVLSQFLLLGDVRSEGTIAIIKKFNIDFFWWISILYHSDIPKKCFIKNVCLSDCHRT